MFTINDDNSISVTRGDTIAFSVTAEKDGENYLFQAGDVLRIKVFEKKNCENVVLQKDFPVTRETESVDIFLTEQETKIGEVISKPKDYWYEVELNPLTNPQTIIGYDEEGARLFKVFPEGRDLAKDDPVIEPEDIPFVDDVLDMTSPRPVENQAIARAVTRLSASIDENKELTEELAEHLGLERARLNNLVSTASDASDADYELKDIRVGADGKTYSTAGEAVRGQVSKINSAIKTKCGKNLYNPEDDVEGYLKTDGEITIYSDWMTTGYIDVEGLESVVASNGIVNSTNRQPYNLLFLCVYDANKTFIEQVYDTGAETYTIGENVRFIRFSYHRDNIYNLQVESGAKRTAYEPYTETQEFSNNKTYALANEVAGGFDSVAVFFERETEKKEITKTSTLAISLKDSYILDGGKSNTFGYPLLVTSGDIDFKVTEKIDVAPFNAYLITASAVFNNLFYAIYDKNDNLLKYEADLTGTREGSIIQDKLIFAPYNASYIILSQYDPSGISSSISKISAVTSKNKPYINKKWVCMGDSLTEKNLRSTLNYHDYIADNTGITVVNMGRSGSGYKRTEDEGFAFYQRIANVPKDADVVTIFGSGNDLKLADVLGAPTDKGTDTICGCINTTIDNLYAVLPTVPLGIISPTPWIYNQPSNNGTMSRYAEALKEICALRGIPFLDLFHCSGLRPNEKTFRELAYSKDEGNGVHPDETGHKLIAPRIKAFLDSLIM